jgi:hypothetical protein
MNIPLDVKKIKDAFSVDQVNTHLMEGWMLIAITPRPGANGPLYTLGWSEAGSTPERARRTAASRARGIAD